MPAIEDIWALYDDVETRLTASVSERMLDLAGVGVGMRVLDLGTGRGEPALKAAARVGAAGVVFGIDRSDGMLRMARRKAKQQGLTNLDFRAAQAESLGDIPAAHFHAATCRWGLMYFDDPVAALVVARRALLPGAPLVAALWAEPERVGCHSLPRRILERYRTVPPIDVEVPGMFRFATRERIVRDFREAGLALDVWEEMDVPVFEATSAREVVAWTRALGNGIGRMVDELAERDQREWEDDLAKELEATRTADGPIQVGGVTRIVRARGESAGS